MRLQAQSQQSITDTRQKMQMKLKRYAIIKSAACVLCASGSLLDYKGRVLA